MNAATLLSDLRQTRRETLRRYAGLDPARLQDAAAWREKPAPLIFLLSWLAEADDARRVRIEDTRGRLGMPLTAGHRALVTAGETRGRLLGALMGLSDAQFDQAATAGEWSVRETLGHVIATDNRYVIGTEYAVRRARDGGAGPLRPPDSALPARSGAVERQGMPAEFLTRLDEVRDDVVRRLANIPDALLAAPTNWMAWDLDVRFRIHRFAAHDREHTIQLRKILSALPVVQNEPQLLLADAQAARGAVEALLLITPTDMIEREPPDGGPSISALIQAALTEERRLQAE